MSKVSRDTILECVNTVLEQSKEKNRKFLETIELQVGGCGSGAMVWLISRSLTFELFRGLLN